MVTTLLLDRFAVQIANGSEPLECLTGGIHSASLVISRGSERDYEH